MSADEPSGSRRPAVRRTGARRPGGQQDAGERAGQQRAGGQRGGGQQASGDQADAGRRAGAQADALKSRGAELRQAAGLPGARLRPILDAALAEVDAAADALASQRAPGGASGSGAAAAERRLLHAVFSHLPVPVFLVGQDGTIRRANSAAAQLLGSAPGYATGRQFAALVNLPDRARVRAELTGAFSSAEPRRVSCAMLGAAGLVAAALTFRLAGLRGDSDQLIVTVAESSPAAEAAGGGQEQDSADQPGQLRPASGNGAVSSPRRPEPGTAKPRPAGRQRGQAPAGQEQAGQDQPGQAVAAGRLPAAGPAAEPAAAADLELVRQLSWRLDLSAGLARMLLEHVAAGEAAMVQRCARMLAGALATFVIIDVETGGRLQRRFVAGPDDPTADELARVAADASPDPDSAPALVHASASSQLLTHAEDASALGAAPDGTPLMALLQAASVLCVPLSAGERGHGALTLVRQAGDGYFTMTDVAVAESAGEQLAFAIQAGRTFRRHSAVADAFRASLLPRELPQAAGVEFAAAHIAARDADVGGDFYDVYETSEGTGLAIGTACGAARNAVSVTSVARNAIRAIARSAPDPAGVLRRANDVLVAENLKGEFVTAHAMTLSWHGSTLRVAVSSAGHPAPTLITADGQVRQLRGGGQPLGIFEDAEPALQRLELTAGDALFFPNAGLLGARHSETSFGDRVSEELAALAGQPAAELAGAMRRRVLEFSDDVRDDVTMLVLRVTEPPDL
ncbi:MAG TPA: SpoIIE family protein phosphatase [Streptosporangiaceae bacterium]|jgi:serine phosphatase RsbU (regulator of sigma subunit)/PAS domain-containing protein